MSEQPQSARAAQRVVLDGVPKVGYGVHLCPFPGSLYAYLQYTGDPCDYDYILGVSGAAFRRFWEKNDGSNVDLMHLAPQPYKRILDALGYEYQVVPAKREEEMLKALKESIAKGRPVLAFGIVGPPECGLVTGYDKDGEVAIGYSYFQDAKIKGYYEQPDWFKNSSWSVGFLCIGDKSKPRPSERDVLVSTLKWAVDLARTVRRPELPNHLSGLAAYDGWADGLEVDADFTDDPEIQGTREMVHGDQCCMLEDRRGAAGYLRQMSKAVPEVADDLNAAADLYDAVANEGAALWPWPCDGSVNVGKVLCDASIRREMAQRIRTARHKEMRAVEHLEKALKALDSALSR